MMFRDRLPRQRTQPTERFPVTSGSGRPPSRSVPTGMNEMLQRMAAAKRAAMARGETPVSNPRPPRIQPMPGRERITSPMQPMPVGNGAPGPGGPSNPGAWGPGAAAMQQQGQNQFQQAQARMQSPAASQNMRQQPMAENNMSNMMGNRASMYKRFLGGN